MDQAAEHVPSFDWRSGRPPDLLRCWVSGGHGQVQSPVRPLRDVVSYGTLGQLRDRLLRRRDRLGISDAGLEHSLEVPTTVEDTK